MVAVLLTRPLAASQALAQELDRLGYACIVEPLLTIEPLKTPRPDISGVQAVMITSGNVFGAGDASEQALFGLPCFCVGQRTATKARAVGFRHVHSASSDGAELARTIEAALQNNLPGKKAVILHISGRDIDSKAQDELSRLGHKVIAWPVYAAQPAAALTEQTIGLIKRRKLNAVLIFSVRTAEALTALLARDALEACCKDLAAIGLSDAVANILRPLPWHKLVAAPVPTEEAMIECLKRIYPVS